MWQAILAVVIQTLVVTGILFQQTQGDFTEEAETQGMNVSQAKMFHLIACAFTAVIVGVVTLLSLALAHLILP